MIAGPDRKKPRGELLLSEEPMSAPHTPAAAAHDGESLVIQAGQPRLARIESLRAVAALAVVVCHVFAYSHHWAPVIFQGYLHRALMGGGFGVELFFVLSGYLMYRPFARRDFGGRGPIDLKTYARNRALRILPLYYVAMVVLLVFTQHGGTSEQWWRFSFFAQSFSARTAQTVDGPMWSLVVELQFYVLLPLLAMAVGWVSRHSRGRGIIALLAVGAPSLAMDFVNPKPFVEWKFSLPEMFFYFIPGMVLAVAQLSIDERRPSWLRGAFARTDTWMLAGTAVWLLIFWNYSLVPLAGIASVLFLAAVVLPLRPGPLVRLLDVRPLVLVGVASYSLYLWHVPIIEHVYKASWLPTGTVPLIVVAGALSLAAAAVSYTAIERPALRLRGRWENPNSRSTDPQPAPADGSSAVAGAPRR